MQVTRIMRVQFANTQNVIRWRHGMCFGNEFTIEIIRNVGISWPIRPLLLLYIAKRSRFFCPVLIWVTGCFNFDYLDVRVILSSLICGFKMHNTIHNK